VAFFSVVEGVVADSEIKLCHHGIFVKEFNSRRGYLG
jgi:3-deoxy-D-manno-octulosonate 8-phosphate phosphatase KdsC-like HAD superfamily phosphatase